ncbi:MAG: hypothetical protein KKH61_21555, partial [Gammaproteobacteria bacterium]|nr:hypothetical protein [Gammaproteobacteria bacterium]
MLKFKTPPSESPPLAQYIDTVEAREYLRKEADREVTLTTIITWIKQYGLGRKIGGRWQVDKIALNKF